MKTRKKQIKPIKVTVTALGPIEDGLPVGNITVELPAGSTVGQAVEMAKAINAGFRRRALKGIS